MNCAIHHFRGVVSLANRQTVHRRVAKSDLPLPAAHSTVLIEFFINAQIKFPNRAALVLNILTDPSRFPYSIRIGVNSPRIPKIPMHFRQTDEFRLSAAAAPLRITEIQLDSFPVCLSSPRPVARTVSDFDAFAKRNP